MISHLMSRKWLGGGGCGQIETVAAWKWVCTRLFVKEGRRSVSQSVSQAIVFEIVRNPCFAGVVTIGWLEAGDS